MRKTLNCLVVDDEEHAIDVLKHYISLVPFLNLETFSTSPLEALQLINTRPVDLAFLDIQMPELSGLDLTRAIGGKCGVILTTAYSEFATEGFELEVMDYLVKPIRFPRFLKAANRALKILAPAEAGIAEESTLADDYLFVKTEVKGKMVKINLKDIDYVEGMKNYQAIHHGGLRTLALLTMKEIEERLPARYFARVHKSFLVAVDKITMIEGSRVFLKNIVQNIPIGEAYRSSFLNLMKRKII